MTLTLNPDILSTVSAIPPPPFTIGFAAETENVIQNAFKKLKQKKLDMIIANQIGANLGFENDENHLFILRKGSKEIVELPLEHKSVLAKKIVELIAEAVQHECHCEKVRSRTNNRVQSAFRDCFVLLPPLCLQLVAAVVGPRSNDCDG